jgi:hypothetical protein
MEPVNIYEKACPDHPLKRGEDYSILISSDICYLGMDISHTNKLKSNDVHLTIYIHNIEKVEDSIDFFVKKCIQYYDMTRKKFSSKLLVFSHQLIIKLAKPREKLLETLYAAFEQNGYLHYNKNPEDLKSKTIFIAIDSDYVFVPCVEYKFGSKKPLPKKK